MAEIENGPELQHLLHCKLNPNTPITFFFKHKEQTFSEAITTPKPIWDTL